MSWRQWSTQCRWRLPPCHRPLLSFCVGNTVLMQSHIAMSKLGEYS
jgi:hypothetical protein